jgi:hypothetical protein
MPKFQTNPTVAAKDLMRSNNPERMSLEELRELKKECEALLSEIWKLVGSKNYMSAPERTNLRIRRFEMEMFIARILDLINANQAEISLIESGNPSEIIRPNLFF